MSKYTTEVRYICEEYAGYDESQDGNKVNDIIDAAKDQIFEDYEIFDENYRGVLNAKILRHYYTREIGLETVGLWKLKLNTKMDEIMPYYNQLYRSALLEFNPLYDFTITTERTATTEGSATNSASSESSDVTHDEGTNSASSTGTGSTTKEQTDQYSDTPQQSLTDLKEGKYLTSFDYIQDGETNESSATSSGTSSADGSVNRTGSSNGQSSATTTQEYLENVSGKRGGESYSAMLREYRKTFLNIDMMVIEELEDLFMNVW